MTTPFPGANIPEHLVPNQPGTVPEAPGAGDATARLSPFKQALDVDAIIKNIVLDRPLKLFIPNMHRYPEYEFHIINSIPQEIADAHNKGWKEVDDPELSALFTDLVAGTDKTGKAFRPILHARPKAVGKEVRRRQRMQLRSLYDGMDPRNKDMSGKYTKGVGDRDGTFGNFEGPSWRIRV